MILTLLLGAVVGGVVAFIWGAVSWMALPWHHACYRPFRDEDAVTRVLTDNAPTSGMYSLPEPTAPKNMTKEEQAAHEAAVMEKMQRGPIVLAVIQRQGFGSLAGHMVVTLFINMLAALLFAFLLLQTTGLPYLGRAGFVGLAGLAGAAICRLPDWNWHGYSTRYTLTQLTDAYIGWQLVGLAIAGFTVPE